VKTPEPIEEVENDECAGINDDEDVGLNQEEDDMLRHKHGHHHPHQPPPLPPQNQRMYHYAGPPSIPVRISNFCLLIALNKVEDSSFNMFYVKSICQ